MKLKDEIESIDIFTRSIQDEIIKSRVQQVLEWNIKKSTNNKIAFYILNILVLVLNASIPIVNQLNGHPAIVTAISSIGTVITGIIALINFKDVWYRYRSTTESIKRECIMLSCRYGEYENEDRENKFIINFEKILLDERDLWAINRFEHEIENE
ncbi:DUF4231 domain-containing protein [Romboutsia sp. MSSM.1001216sp_RTP31141st1_G3_RTP31141_220114]|uniref:DUF4231 domain-containing protein n=1 Tax=unclassified Romboutsia TaxID=2626894 RepID=UPI0031B602E8